jgi:hypothetical protein
MNNIKTPPKRRRDEYIDVFKQPLEFGYLHISDFHISEARCVNTKILFIIISLLMSPLLGHRPSLWKIRTGYNPPRGPSANWWVLMTVNTAKIT